MPAYRCLFLLGIVFLSRQGKFSEGKCALRMALSNFLTISGYLSARFVVSFGSLLDIIQFEGAVRLNGHTLPVALARGLCFPVNSQ